MDQPRGETENRQHAVSPQPEHWRREHYIPLRKPDLVDLLLRDPKLTADQQQAFSDFCCLVEAILNFESHERHEVLKNLYAPFDPDRETVSTTISPDEREELAAELFEKFAALLKRANFQRLSSDEMEDAIGAASDWGVRLHVEFEVFRHLAVYGRGDVISKRRRRRLMGLLRSEEVDVPIYKRLAVILQLRQHERLEKDVDTDCVYIKLFKNIPKQDMDMMLPGTRVRMTLADQGKILLPTLSGLGLTLVKLVKGALVLAFAGVYGFLAFIGLVGGTIGYGVKSILGYQRTRDKYTLDLTRNLYYQNLDKNAGVLHRLNDEAQAQEFRETVMGYFLLWQNAPHHGWTARQLDEQAESKLRAMTTVDIDFEVHDALTKLKRFELLEASSENRWRATSLDQALLKLDQYWNSRFEHASGQRDHLDSK